MRDIIEWFLFPAGKESLVLGLHARVLYMYSTIQIHICTFALSPARSVPKRGTIFKQIDKQIDKPSPHIRSRFHSCFNIGLIMHHTDPLVAKLLSQRARLDVASGMQISTLINMSNRHSAMHVQMSFLPHPRSVAQWQPARSFRFPSYPRSYHPFFKLFFYYYYYACFLYFYVYVTMCIPLVGCIQYIPVTIINHTSPTCF